MNLKSLIRPLAAAAGLMASSLALAYPAQVIADLNLRAGPSSEFPVVRIIPARVRVEVLGCESDYAWCDIDVDGQRGWANARYLEATYDGRTVVVAQQGPSLAVPIISFVVGVYWASHYRDRYWYNRWHHWNRWHYRPHAPGWRPPHSPRPPVLLPPPRPPVTAPPHRPQPYPPAVVPPQRPPVTAPPQPRPPVNSPSQRPPQRPPEATPPQRPPNASPPPQRPSGERPQRPSGDRPQRPAGERPQPRSGGNN